MNSRSNNDLVAEAVAAIGPWRAFLNGKRAEIQAQIAQMQAQGNMDPQSQGAGAPMPPPPPPSLLDADASEEMPWAEEEAEGRGGDVAPPPSLLGRFVPSPVGELEIPSTEEEADVALRTSVAPSPSVPMTVPSSDVKATGLETLLTPARIALLPASIQAAWQDRARDPERLAQVMVGASKQGLLPVPLPEVIRGLVETDPHFQSAHTLYEMGLYPELFDVDGAVQGAEAEADRAVRRGEAPF